MVVKGLIKPQEDDELFNALDRIFDIPVNETKHETSEDIKNRILNKIRGGG